MKNNKNVINKNRNKEYWVFTVQLTTEVQLAIVLSLLQWKYRKDKQGQFSHSLNKNKRFKIKI